ncbi:MAG TPA: winged helix-turn-helix domain-containing protein [Nocardioides sp.]|nr:winged helix-turn-helix domain-containing protein [Nocardioides sp.]
MREDVHRWVERAGAQVLVVDPDEDGGRLAEEMAGRGVHVTWVGSTTDGLVELGRTDPHAVVVAPRTPGIPVEEFVGVVRRHGSSYVIAGAASVDATAEVGPLLLAGASAVVVRPYAAEPLWELLVHAPRSLSEHARVEVGPIALDATAYSVRLNGERIADLPLKEFELLRALMLRAPGVVSDEELREALWGTSGRRVGPNTVAMHAARLRTRLAGAAVVRRVRGRGYSLGVEPG